MLFTHPREEPVTPDVIQDFIKEHRTLIPAYEENKRMYEGDHDILHRTAREAYKPDNRLVVNFARLIVDTFNGYFIGIPAKHTHEDEAVHEAIRQFNRRSMLEDQEAELAKMTSVYGHAFEYLYQDEDANTKIIENSPLDMFVVCDDSIMQRPLFAVRYQYDTNGELSGELIDSTHRYSLSGTKLGKVSIGDEQPHYYGGVPVIEYIENEERQPIFENVKTLINALNNALSAKMDDVDYFADAYLVVKGADLDEETMTDLREKRTINLTGDGTDDVVIEFLEKPNADKTQENLINRLIDLIFQVSGVANISDETFSGASSGVALEFKLQPMKNLAIMKERKFRRAMQERFKLFFALPTNIAPNLRDAWMDINYQFSRNIPRNLADEAATASKLEGVVSKNTQLQSLSIVDDVQTEMERMEEENAAAPVYDFEMGE